MRIQQRGQVTIPKKLRDEFGLHPDVEVEFTPTERGLLLKRKADGLDQVRGILGPDALCGLTVDEYVDEVRRGGLTAEEYLRAGPRDEPAAP